MDSRGDSISTDQAQPGEPPPKPDVLAGSGFPAAASGRLSQEQTMRRIFVFAAAAAALAVAACNTVAGVGEDVEAAGQATTEAAREAQN
jgi:predicted small secreted protein